VTLQRGLAGMNILSWQANQWRAEPVPGADGAQAADPSGLQVGLVVQGKEVPMIKFFLLGGT
jgi:general secretion pathway protein J